MPIRVEILEDGKARIMRSWVNDPLTKWLTLDNAEAAIRILPYLIRREERRVLQERFVPQLDMECKALLAKEMKARKHART